MRIAVVLAGGKGTKLWPYSDVRPKALIPIANQPLLGRTIAALLQLDLDGIIVAGGHLGEQTQAYVFGRDRISYVATSDCSGTAYALRKALGQLAWEECLVVYGDVVVDVRDLRRVLEHRRRNRLPAVALVKPLLDERPTDWTCAAVHDDELKEVLGHPRGGVTHRICGVYAFGTDAIPYVWTAPGHFTSVQVGVMPPLESEIADCVQAMLDAGLEVGAVEPEGCFVDIDKPWHILEANETVVEHMSGMLQEDAIHPTARISDNAEIHGHIVVGENSVIGPRTVVRGNLWVGRNTIIDNGPIIGSNVVIGDSCTIDDYCKIESGSIIGNRCMVRHGAELAGTIMDNVYLYHFMIVTGLVGVSTDIGGGTICGTLRFDDASTIQVVKGRREIPSKFANAVYIGDYCRTGVGVMIMPGCKVGSYSIVGPGVVLYEDLPSKTILMARQELSARPWGPDKYGW